MSNQTIALLAVAIGLGVVGFVIYKEVEKTNEQIAAATSNLSNTDKLAGQVSNVLSSLGVKG